MMGGTSYHIISHGGTMVKGRFTICCTGGGEEEEEEGGGGGGGGGGNSGSVLEFELPPHVMWPLTLLPNKFPMMDDGQEGVQGKVIGGADCSLLVAGDDDVDNPENNRLGKPNYSCNSRSSFVDVPHVRQLFNWDCGLACVLMVLRTLGINHCDIHYLEGLCPTRSIWTVDLAYLLNRFSVAFSFFTVTIGANPEFYGESYYKEQLQDDLERVDALFEKAHDVGIVIQHRSISGKEISGLILSGNYIAVALVDKYKMSNPLFKDLYVSGFYGGNFKYIGHYIVICGYDMVTDQFDIRDPASSRKHDKVSLKCLDEARKSFGTDEDILLICLNNGDGKA